MNLLPDTAADDLDAIYAEDDAALDFAAEPQPLDGLDAINRRMATLAVARRDLANYDATATALRAELEDRITRGRATLVERVGWYERSLQVSHQAILAEDPDRRRIVLPNGTLSLSAGGVEWVWPEDEDEAQALVSWTEEHLPEAFSLPDPPAPRVNRTALKAACKTKTLTKRNGVQAPALEGRVLTDDGELVPGVAVRSKETTTQIHTAGE